MKIDFREWFMVYEERYGGYLKEKNLEVGKGVVEK